MVGTVTYGMYLPILLLYNIGNVIDNYKLGRYIKY